MHSKKYLKNIAPVKYFWKQSVGYWNQFTQATMNYEDYNWFLIYNVYIHANCNKFDVFLIHNMGFLFVISLLFGWEYCNEL